MDITIVPYKLPDSVPTPKDECGWIALYHNEAIGWNSLLFLSDRTIKFANAYVKEEYRGHGVYRRLWNARWDWCEANLKGYKVITYCLPTTHQFYKDKGWEEGDTSTLFTSFV
tara:strand:- start:237 stop:575 length:339 start_codon:yes stop_codon:yes gene_type:complete